MRKRWGIIPLLAIAPMVSAHSLNDQQPLQYDYLNMDVSSGTVSDLYAAGDSDNVTGLLFGVSHKWMRVIGCSSPTTAHAFTTLTTIR